MKGDGRHRATGGAGERQIGLLRASGPRPGWRCIGAAAGDRRTSPSGTPDGSDAECLSGQIVSAARARRRAQHRGNGERRGPGTGLGSEQLRGVEHHAPPDRGSHSLTPAGERDRSATLQTHAGPRREATEWTGK